MIHADAATHSKQSMLLQDEMRSLTKWGQQSVSKAEAETMVKKKAERKRQKSRNWFSREKEKANGVKVTFSGVQQFENRTRSSGAQTHLKTKTLLFVFSFFSLQPVTPNFDEKNGQS